MSERTGSAGLGASSVHPAPPGERAEGVRATRLTGVLLVVSAPPEALLLVQQEALS